MNQSVIFMHLLFCVLFFTVLCLSVPRVHASLFCYKYFDKIFDHSSSQSEKEIQRGFFSRLINRGSRSLDNPAILKKTRKRKATLEHIQALDIEQLTWHEFNSFLSSEHIELMTQEQQIKMMNRWGPYDLFYETEFFNMVEGHVVMDYLDQIRDDVSLSTLIISKLNENQILQIINAGSQNTRMLKDLLNRYGGVRLFDFRTSLFKNQYITPNEAHNVMGILYKVMDQDALMEHFRLIQKQKLKNSNPLEVLFDHLTFDMENSKSTYEQSLIPSLEYHIPKGNIDPLLTRLNPDVLNELSPKIFTEKVFTKLGVVQINGLSYNIVSALPESVFRDTLAVHINPKYLTRRIQNQTLSRSTISMLKKNLEDAKKIEEIVSFLNFDLSTEEHVMEVPLFAFPKSIKQAFEVLGIDKDASPEEIREAYLKLTKEWHPDSNSHPHATKNTQSINRAYELLKNGFNVTFEGSM